MMGDLLQFFYNSSKDINNIVAYLYPRIRDGSHSIDGETKIFLGLLTIVIIHFAVMRLRHFVSRIVYVYGIIMLAKTMWTSFGHTIVSHGIDLADETFQSVLSRALQNVTKTA